MVWLYRGETERYLKLVDDYLRQAAEQGQDFVQAHGVLEVVLRRCQYVFRDWQAHGVALSKPDEAQAVTAAGDQLQAAIDAWFADSRAIEGAARQELAAAQPAPAGNAEQQAARAHLESLSATAHARAQRLAELLKLSRRLVELVEKQPGVRRGDKSVLPGYTTQLNEIARWERIAGQAQQAARQLAYWLHQAAWLQTRFPQAQYADVAGLCKAVTLAEIAEKDWSLTPGRYVGVAQASEDSEDDFFERIKEIHFELAELDRKSSSLAQTISENFEMLGGLSDANLD